MARYEFSKKGYVNSDEILRGDLITVEADEIGGILAVKAKLSNSQLRAFYNEVKALETKIGDKVENFPKNYPMILMMKSKAAYKKGSQSSKIPLEFKDFIDENIDLIKKRNGEGKGKQAFDNFVIFFEAVVGYFYGHGGKGNR